MGVDERKESRKRQRANDAEDESEAEHCVTQLMRGVVEGELMQSSSGSEYEPKIEEEGDSGGEISLEAESDVDGEMWETMGTDDDVGLEHNMAECSNAGVRSRRSSDGGAGGAGDRRGSYRRGVERRSTKEESGKLEGQRKSAIRKARGGNEEGSVGGTVEECDVMLRARCTLKKLVAVNATVTPLQRVALEGTMLEPFLQYCDIVMERHLTLALIRCWVPRWKAFRIAGRGVPFSMFDVSLFMGLPATGRRVQLDAEEVASDIAIAVRGRVAEWEAEEMGRRVPGRSGKKRRFFRNYISAMLHYVRSAVQTIELRCG